MIIYNVMNNEEWVGCFYCGSFSTRELAQASIDKFLSENPSLDLFIQEYLVDSGE